jgi:mRNA interferase MazF
LEIERGNIVIVNLNPTKGTEQRGIRPAVIVQSDRANNVSPHTIIIPLTTNIKKAILPCHTLIKKSEGIIKDSISMAEQIRVIDKSRVVNIIGKLSNETMKRIDKSLKIILDLQ